MKHIGMSANPDIEKDAESALLEENAALKTENEALKAENAALKAAAADHKK